MHCLIQLNVFFIKYSSSGHDKNVEVSQGLIKAVGVYVDV